MIEVRRSTERGHADYGWLDTRHTFSFGSYLDPKFMGFSALRVINQDVIAANQGFSTHSHDNMEIISYVLEGELVHEDSMGNRTKMEAHEVQVMSAGTGITHSEFNGSDSNPVHLLQIWIEPRQRNTQPQYQQRRFDPEELTGRLRLVVSPDGAAGSLAIKQDARVYIGKLADGQSDSVELDSGRAGWLHVAIGRIDVDGTSLGPGDSAALTGQSKITVTGFDLAEVVLFDLPEERTDG